MIEVGQVRRVYGDYLYHEYWPGRKIIIKGTAQGTRFWTFYVDDGTLTSATEEWLLKNTAVL